MGTSKGSQSNLALVKAIGIGCLLAATGTMGAAHFKDEIPMTAVLAFAVIGAVLLIFYALYNRFTDKVSCHFCDAKVLSVYAESMDTQEGKEIFLCYVCERRLSDYPLGSESVPDKVPCNRCKREYHSVFLRMTSNGAICCPLCVVELQTLKDMVVELCNFAAAKGVRVSASVAQEWMRSMTYPTSGPRTWTPFAVYLLVVVTGILWLTR